MSPDVTEQKMRADARRSRARLIEGGTGGGGGEGADARLDDRARGASVGIGTLYRHFPTRIDVQAAVFRSQVPSVCSQADGIMVSSSPEQAFAVWLRVLARYLVTKRGLSRAVMESLGKDSELVSSCYLAMHQTVDRLLASGQQAGVLRTDLTSRDVLRLVHGVAITTEQAPEETDRLLSLLLDGMRPQLLPLERGRAVLVGRAEDDGGAGRHVRDTADLLEQFLKRGRGGHADLEDVVLVAGDAMAGLDRHQVAQPLGQVVRGGRVEWLNRHEGGQRKPDHVWIAQRAIPHDDAFRFQPAHPLVNGGH